MTNSNIGLSILETLTSALYDDPIIIFREYVQNSVDAYNLLSINEQKTIKNFSVDINVDEKKKNIIIHDNGLGIPSSNFENLMKNFGLSPKARKPNQIGFRGIGRLSAMPFCTKLIFKNKVRGSKSSMYLVWKGDEFHKLLNQKTEPELIESINRLTEKYEEPYSGNANDHFFEVTIQDYGYEIISLLRNKKELLANLKMMLPLKYNPKFLQQKKIKEKYHKYMGGRLDRFEFNITFNGEKLYKPYTNDHILDSDIVFWEFRYKNVDSLNQGDKIGLLWFSFNRLIKANDKDQPHGILVRSKNMLMGNRYTIADVVSKLKSDTFIGTFRELTQTIQGVYGELLIHSEDLNDNARRDWFKIETPSIQLSNIIFNFMLCLYNYRKIASKALNNIANDENRKKLTTAFIELTSNPQPKDFISEFYEEKKIHDKKKKIDNLKLANEDFPSSSITFKKYYEQIMTHIEEYYHKNKKIEEFLKIRAYIRKRIK